MRQILEDVGHILEYCLIAVVMVLIGLGAGYFFRKNIAEGKLNQAEQEAARIIANGERTAESVTISPPWIFITSLNFLKHLQNRNAGAECVI